jgi:hypothetical protein
MFWLEFFLAQQRNRSGYGSALRRDELAGHFRLFINPTSKTCPFNYVQGSPRESGGEGAGFCKALTLGLAWYLASAGG